MSQLATLGKYHIIELLAADEVSEIFKVKTLGIAGFEKVQVLKRILPQYSSDPTFARAFIAEAKIAFSLNHRNIVQVFEFGKVDGDLFLAVEYIPGMNLQKVMRRVHQVCRPVPVGLVCYLMGEVAAGLEYAHRKTDQSGQKLGVVHCAVTPQNIACSFEGSVKILDFGISCALWTVLRRHVLLRAEPHYLAPEQLRGEPVDFRSDLFSFGVILWELLAGRSAVEGRQPEPGLQATTIADLAPPRTLNPDVPSHLDELTMRCLAQPRDARIASASDLQLELHRIQRMLGAVIGTRALSAFLQDIFPDHDDGHDVRHEAAEPLPEATEPQSEAGRSDALVNAATELAAPPNPPAQPILEWSSVAAALRPHSGVEGDEPDSIVRSGVLRNSRSVQEEVTVGPSRRRRSPQNRSGRLSTSSSQEVTIGLIREQSGVPTARAKPLPPEPPDQQQPRQSIVVRGDTIHEDLTLSELIAIAEQDTIKSQPDQPLHTRIEPQSGVDAATAALGEKKRFIAAAVLLRGPRVLQDEGLELIADIAFKLDGLVHERTPEHLVALFGLPIADENDIVSAVRFALDAREAVAQLGPADANREAARAPSDGEATRIRVGIRAGSARLGDPHRQTSGGPVQATRSSPGLTSASYQVLGKSVEETLVLARQAAPGQILLSGAAAHLAALHYRLADESSRTQHGKRSRCQTLIGQLPQGSHNQLPGSAFVGREVELRVMRGLWREVLMRGVQHSVMVSGQPGIGKTRLLEEFIALHTAKARAVMVTATPHCRDAPYALLLDLLWALTQPGSVTVERSNANLLAAVEQALGQQDDGAVAVLRALFTPESAPSDSVEGRSPGRVQMFLRALMNQICASRPTLVAVDGLHYADSGSRECLRALFERPEDSAGPLFCVFTERVDADATVQNQTANVSAIMLEELDERDSERLIVEELGERATPTLIQEVMRRAGGNPFYISELTRTLRELDPARPSEIPPTVHGVVAGRIDRLPSNVKLLLQHAAVIGPTFREGVLGKLIGRNPARSLALLRNAGLIVPGLRTVAPAATKSGVSEQFEREWAFRHLLIQELVYDAISGPARRNLHRQVAEIMLKRIKRGSTDSTAELARHLEASGQTRLAAEYYLSAAKKAAAAFASREAVELFGSALRLGEGDPEHDYQVHAGRERVFAQLGLHQRQAEDLEALSLLCGDNPARLADLRNREAHQLLRLGELRHALNLADEAVAASLQAGDELCRGEAMRLRGEAFERLNDHQRALQSATVALQIFESQNTPSRQVQARISLGRIHLMQANYEQALAHYTPALALLKQIHDPWQERVLRNYLAAVHYCRGDFAKALSEALHSLQLCEQFGDRAREGDNASVVGIVYLDLGLYDFARRYLEDALATHRETSSRWSEADTLVYLGLLETCCHNFAGALRLLEEAQQLADSLGAKYIAINARNALAWSLCERNSPGDAARAVTEATTAVTAAQKARLIIGEIPGLSRSARATALKGDLKNACSLSRHAVDLLAEQRVIESSEEEIYYTHFCILDAMHDLDALQFLDLAHAGLCSKLERMEKQEWREAFQRVRLNTVIMRDYLRLKTKP